MECRVSKIFPAVNKYDLNVANQLCEKEESGRTPKHAKQKPKKGLCTFG